MATAKRILNITSNVLFVVFIAVMIMIVGFMVKAKLDGGDPNIAGYQFMTVLSGSMEPTFMTGSMIAVEPVDPETITAGDIITFKKEDEASGKVIVVTHRVIEVISTGDGPVFKTKGDNNNAEDDGLTLGANVIGKEVFDIPYGGYIAEFARSKKGLIVLIGIPGLFIILAECRKLWKYAVEYDREQEEKKALEAQATESAGVQ